MHAAMENIAPSPSPQPSVEEKETMEVDKRGVDPPAPDHQQYQQLISTLPLQEIPPIRLRNYQGFWYMDHNLRGVLAMRERFVPRPGDVFLVSTPKSGTTWLKALSFSIATRKDYCPSDDRHPLLARNPHECVPFVHELFTSGQDSSLDSLPPPRLLATHTPYLHLPEPAKASSECRIVYVCREPKDTLVSGWNFTKGFIGPGSTVEPTSFAEHFNKFCKGVSPFGPVWEHCLEYWRESLRSPEKVLFFKYESMKEDPVGSVRRLAEFIGQPFSQEEEEEGAVEEIVRLCSFEKLSSLDVNQTGQFGPKTRAVKNSSFFRKGEVGDWKNYFTAEMAGEMDRITQEKLAGSGLSFGNE